MVAEYMCVEEEKHIRQRLIVFLRFQSLRLSIRHMALTSNEHDLERRKTSVSICKAMIEAIRSYMMTTTSLKPCGYILTTTLVEVMYHVIPEESHPAPIASHGLLKGMVHDAIQLLQTLSESVATASKVCRYLENLLPLDDPLTASTSQMAVKKAPFLSSSTDLETLSEKFWKIIVDQPGQGTSSAPTHTQPSIIEIDESFVSDYLPFQLNDLQSQFV
ncbi:uncharacterized protein N7479_009720 [Penicillium vulpinum]|uniref:uncharacterized protein n=1 Tax=Penicillium vulpinum TaxID=29845 RepID=UPI0025470DC8|nr:uncharacterized protein N7479_009720 [Penicillium vulpinum]KAJ5951307.1 hypothetical protein N7479_009720 [Penicillium vulpinum]